MIIFHARSSMQFSQIGPDRCPECNGRMFEYGWKHYTAHYIDEEHAEEIEHKEIESRRCENGHRP